VKFLAQRTSRTQRFDGSATKGIRHEEDNGIRAQGHKSGRRGMRLKETAKNLYPHYLLELTPSIIIEASFLTAACSSSTAIWAIS